MGRPRILLADSSTFTRIVLANALEAQGFEVVAVAKSASEAVDKFTRLNPDITLVDLELAGIDGIEVIRALAKQDPSAAVALLIPEEMSDPDVIVEAVKAGARSYIRKPTSGEEIARRLTNLMRKRGEQ